MAVELNNFVPICSFSFLFDPICSQLFPIAPWPPIVKCIFVLRAQKPGLLFLDISMAAKNGFYLLKELKEFNFEVIFVTAHDQFMIDAIPFQRN
jgi:two-component system LytT family response regulator